MRFYTTATNSRGNEVKTGGKTTGQIVHARGWNAGIEVRSFIDRDGCDAFNLFATSGSNGETPPRHLGVLKDTEEDGPVFLPAKGAR